MSIEIENGVMSQGYLGKKWITEIWDGNSRVYHAGTQPLNDYLCFTATAANATVELRNQNIYTTPNLEYTLDGGVTWTTLILNTTITLSASGDKCYIRGNNTTFSTSEASYFYFDTSSMQLSGNVMSLLSKACENVPLSNYVFYKLFYEQTITGMCSLPATELGDSCYESMFMSCNGISMPTLPAMNLKPYCYYNMFANSNIAPHEEDILPALVLVEGCYAHMFENCTSLKEMPTIAALTLASHCCDSMFKNCTSVYIATTLLAETLVTSCYSEMFYGCSKLRSITVNFTAWNDDASATKTWVQGVASSGKFNRAPALEVVYDASHIPESWGTGGQSATTTYHFDSASELQSFTQVDGRAPLQVWVSDSIWHWCFGYTDSGGYFYKNYDDLMAFEIKMQLHGSGSFIYSNLQFTLDSGDVIRWYVKHTGYAPYLPWNNYTNNMIVDYYNTDTKTRVVKKASTPLPYNTWGIFKIDVSGSSIQFYYNNNLYYEFTPENKFTCITKINFCTQDGWWQTKYQSYYDYIIETYEDFDYGDGSLNCVHHGYANNLWINDYKYTYEYIGRYSNCSYNAGVSYNTAYAYGINTDSISEPDGNKMAATISNIYSDIQSMVRGQTRSMEWLIPTTDEWLATSSETDSKTLVNGGTNTITFLNEVPKNYTLHLRWDAGAWNHGYIGSVYLQINGTYYTIKAAVEAGLIKPLVLMASESWSYSYQWSNWFNIYDGGTTSYSNYPNGWVFLMTNASITGIQFYASQSWRGYDDGFYSWAMPIDRLRFHLK